jgi:hypothetical protein
MRMLDDFTSPWMNCCRLQGDSDVAGGAVAIVIGLAICCGDGGKWEALLSSSMVRDLVADKGRGFWDISRMQEWGMHPNFLWPPCSVSGGESSLGEG